MKLYGRLWCLWGEEERRITLHVQVLPSDGLGTASAPSAGNEGGHDLMARGPAWCSDGVKCLVVGGESERGQRGQITDKGKGGALKTVG